MRMTIAERSPLTFTEALARFRTLADDMAWEERQEQLDAAAERAFAARETHREKSS